MIMIEKHDTDGCLDTVMEDFHRLPKYSISNQNQQEEELVE